MLSQELTEPSTTLLSLPDLVMINVLKLLMSNVRDVQSLSLVSRQLNWFVSDNFSSLYCEHLSIDNKTFNLNLRMDKPVLSLKLWIHPEVDTVTEQEEDIRLEDNVLMLMGTHPQSTSIFLKTTIPKLNLKQVRKLTMKCESRQSMKSYLETRDLVFKYINNETLEELDIEFCCLQII